MVTSISRITSSYLTDKTTPDPIAFMSLTVNTSDHLYHDFIQWIFLHARRDPSVLTKELLEESYPFRFLHDVWLPNLKGSVGLILANASVMRISFPVRGPLLCRWRGRFLARRQHDAARQQQDRDPLFDIPTWWSRFSQKKKLTPTYSDILFPWLSTCVSCWK